MKWNTTPMRMFGGSLLVSATFFSSACAVETDGQPIAEKDQDLIGGSQAAPYHKRATIYIQNGCTGAKIGDRFFLTAAHCVDNSLGGVSGSYAPGARMTISNSIVLDASAVYHQLTIAQTSIHPGWTAACDDGCGTVKVLDDEHAPDIAVIEVVEDTPTIPQEYVDLDPVPAGHWASKSGYGCEVSLGGPSPNPRRFKTENAQVIATADFIHPGSYISSMDEASLVNASFVGTWANSEDSPYSWDWASLCPGDSGGPLYSSSPGRGIIGVNAYYTFPTDGSRISLRDWHTRTSNQTRYNVGSWLDSLGVNTVGGGTNEGSGSIQMERWNNISGLSTSSIPLSSAPDQTTTLTEFQIPSNVGDDYGVRVRGYLTAPKTGGYRFFIAGDDYVELYLSSSQSSSGKTLIAHHNGWTNPQEWDKYSSQESGVIQLVAGQSYYIEALMKEAGGGDNLAVGWLQPGESGDSPFQIIPGYQLSPY